MVDAEMVRQMAHLAAAEDDEVRGAARLQLPSVRELERNRRSARHPPVGLGGAEPILQTGEPQGERHTLAHCRARVDVRSQRDVHASVAQLASWRIGTLMKK